MTDRCQKLRKIFSKVGMPIFFFTNDAKVALGLEKIIPNYHIVCIDDNSIIDYLIEDGVKVFCYERATGKRNCLFRSSSLLVAQPEVQKYLEQEVPDGKLAALFFKPCGNPFAKFSQFKVTLLNNSPSINWPLENKIAFFERFSLDFPLPPGEITNLGAVAYEDLIKKYGPKIVVQFGRGWAGNSTFFPKSKDEFDKLRDSYSKAKCKISAFIAGQTAINNACLFGDKVLVSAPFRQITGLAEYTPYAGGTCGNSWQENDFSEAVGETTAKLTESLGEKMRQMKYRGIFGLDFLVTSEGKVIIFENNARLTASIPMFTKLELRAGVVPLLAWHLVEFFGLTLMKEEFPSREQTMPALSGGQLVLRNTSQEIREVSQELTPGVYSFDGVSSWNFKRPGYTIGDLENDREFLILPAAVGREVAPGIEYLRLQSLSPILGVDSQLKPELKRLAELARSKIGLDPPEGLDLK